LHRRRRWSPCLFLLSQGPFSLLRPRQPPLCQIRSSGQQPSLHPELFQEGSAAGWFAASEEAGEKKDFAFVFLFPVQPFLTIL
jgi:hypothetical protein